MDTVLQQRTAQVYRGLDWPEPVQYRTVFLRKCLLGLMLDQFSRVFMCLCNTKLIYLSAFEQFWGKHRA